METLKLINADPSNPAATFVEGVLPRSHVIRFTSPTTNPTGWQFYWGYDNSDPAGPTFYRFSLDSTWTAIHKTDKGSNVNLIAINTPGEITSLYGEFEFSFREIRLGLSNEEYYIALSVTLNHRHILSYIEKTPPVLSRLGFGFLCPAASTVVFRDFYSGELAPIADWISIDPGETPMSAMSRAVEGYYLKYHARHDGSLRAWRAQAADSAAIFTRENTWDYTRTDDYRELKTHVRQLGAYVQTEFLRPDLIRRYGHRFAEIQNPYLMNEAECEEQAEKAILRMEEVTQVESFSTPYRPELEREDRITTPMGDAIASSYSAKLDGTGGGLMGIQTRRYTFGA